MTKDVIIYQFLKRFNFHEKLVLLCFLLSTSIVNLWAQNVDYNNYKNLVTKVITIENDTTLLDSVSILPASFVLTNAQSKNTIDTSHYHLIWASGQLVIKDKSLVGQQLQAVYRAFPYKLEEVVYNKSKDKIIQYNADSIYFNPYYYRPSEAGKTSTIEWGQLNYSGSFARGVSFGSNQNLALNSELDLQLSGLIGKDLRITAALSDNNIPIQPDGNTAQIQDFDNVFIKVEKGKHEVVAGDYLIKEEESYFMRFDKQLQGASYKGEIDILDDLKLNSSISFSIAKGRFTRNTFVGREGNQGPYRLTGSNGETFIVVLAGSEKVYVDNILLKRGEDFDYVMDYNAGEIVFTANYLITKDSRIVVEFEYSDRNYFRTFISTRHTLQYKKLKTYFKFLNEQDNKNNPINVDLSESEELLLSEIGDNLDQAFISGANEVEFTSDRVLYKLEDTVSNGIAYDSIFVFSSNPDSAKFSVSFSYVGPNNGDYEPSINATNGRVYRWVAPDINGQLTGSYVAKLLLVTPKKRQLMAFGLESELGKYVTVAAEGATSDVDVNTFSSEDNGNNRDYAAQANLIFIKPIGKEQKWQTFNKFGYEFKADNFSTIEQYRSVEFNRDWSLGFQDTVSNEHFSYAETRFKAKNMLLGYRFSNFIRSDIYKGFKHNLNLSVERKGWRFNSNSSVLNAEDNLQNIAFLRPQFTLEKDFDFWKGVTFGIHGFQEINKVEAVNSDTLLVSSFLNNNIGAFIASSDTAKVRWKINYVRRVDKEDVGTAFKTASVANTVEVDGSLNKIKSQTLKWKFTYRNLSIADTTLITTEPDNNILGRVEYGFRVKRGAIRFNTLYELGSGQERQREFTYLRVENGDGLYTWIDVNDDNLQQQNEFVISEFADSANFVRVFTNFNTFVQSHVTRFDQSLFLNPKLVWSKEKGIKGFIARLSFQSSVLISKRSLRDSGGTAFNPFALSSKQNNIIAVNASVRNALYVNRNSTKFKINYIQTWSQNKFLLLNGIDARQSAIHQVNTRWNVKRFLALLLEAQAEHKVFDSEFFDENDFDIKRYSVESGAEYTWKTKIRVGLRYNYGWRVNAPQFGGEEAKSHELKWNFKFSLVGKSTVVADFKYVNINYNGEDNSVKSYEILSGLRTGQNYLWNVRFEQKLARNIQISLQYEGRKTGESRLVNTGRASVRALF